MSLKDLRERRSARAKSLREFMDKQEKSGNRWTPEDQTVYDTHMAEIDDLDGQISRMQAVIDLDGDRAFQNAVREGAARRGVDAGGEPTLFNRWLRQGPNALSPDEMQQIRNTMSTTTGSEGGFTVPTEVANRVIDALKAFGGMRAVSEVISMQSGAPLQFPTSDGTTEMGEIVTQNTAAGSQDIVFGSVTIGAYKFGSKVVTVPIELIQDSNVDIEGFVVARIATRLGRIQNNKFTLGSGIGEPTGVITGAPVGVTAATGGATTVTYNNLVDLQHAVDPAYRGPGACRFMFNDNTLKAVRKIVDGNGRPIFVPGYQLQVPGGAPDTLMGDAIQINQDVADLAANAKSIAYGNFQHYLIRDVMDVTMFRFTDSAFTIKGQVGFLAWQRSDGQYLGVGAKGPVQVFQNSAT